MNKKEIGEIKRHTSPNHSTSTTLYGRYVTPSGDVISSFEEPVGRLSEEDLNQYFSLLRDVLNTNVGVKSFTIPFERSEIGSSGEHKLLMDLLASKLKDGSIREKLFESIQEQVQMKGNYLILLDFESYDVPCISKDIECDEVYSYFLCAVCPVEQAKDHLSYITSSKAFHNSSVGYAVQKPVAGFLFPAFHDRCADTTAGLFYAKKPDLASEQLLRAVFRKDFPNTQNEQRTRIAACLTEALGKNCTLEAVEDLRQSIVGIETRALFEGEGSNGEGDVLGKEDLAECLSDSGATAAGVEKFKEAFDSYFGEDEKLPIESILETKKIKIESEAFSVDLTSAAPNVVQIKQVDGERCLVLHIGKKPVQFNGVQIN